MRSQFRSRFVFVLMTHFDPDYTIQWYYNQGHHGKGPQCRGNRQKYDFSTRKIKKKCVINGAEDFAEYENKIINSISCLYLAENEIVAEPQDIETSPKIPRGLLTKQTRFTFSGTAKRATQKFMDTISFH